MPSDFLEIFFENLKDAIPNINLNLVNTIKQLSKKYELVLLTNYFGESQLNRLNNIGIGNYFIECYGESLIKPYKEAYVKACGKYKPSECVMIGDDIFLDIECAMNIVINTIFVNSKNISINNINTVIVKKVEDIDEKLIESIALNRKGD